MICPIMSIGWLSNEWAAKEEDTFKVANLPECVKRECAFWDKDKLCCSFKGKIK